MSETTAVEETPRRAVDSSELTKLEEMNRSGKWGEAVDRFGVQFLVRVHLRKYEFKQVRQLIRAQRIAREEDLRFVRDTLRTMEQRFDVDPRLIEFRTDMTELRRMAQMRLNKIVMLKKELSGGDDF